MDILLLFLFFTRNVNDTGNLYNVSIHPPTRQMYYKNRGTTLNKGQDFYINDPLKIQVDKIIKKKKKKKFKIIFKKIIKKNKKKKKKNKKKKKKKKKKKTFHCPLMHAL